MDPYLRFRSRFEEAMDRRLYTIDHLDRLVASGEARIWTTARAAIVAEIRIYPTGAKDVHGLVAAGDLGDIATVLIPAAEAWGRAQGCIGAVIESRPGWARLLKNQGYEAHQVALRKEF